MPPYKLRQALSLLSPLTLGVGATPSTAAPEGRRAPLLLLERSYGDIGCAVAEIKSGGDFNSACATEVRCSFVQFQQHSIDWEQGAVGR